MDEPRHSPKFQDPALGPMHTCEHIVNRTMVNLYGCGRAVASHIERKKGKLDYSLPAPPSPAEVARIERVVNEVIGQGLPVTAHLIGIDEARTRFDLTRLPEGTGDWVRVVSVGDYDHCLCIGAHASNTSELGRFVILSHDYDAEARRWRMRFRLVKP